MKEMPVSKEVRDAIQLHTNMMNQYQFVINSISACRDSIQKVARQQMKLDDDHDWKFDLFKMAFVGNPKKIEEKKE